MRTRLTKFITKLLSLVLVVILAIPTQIFASGGRKKNNTYDSSTSIMGLASANPVTDTITTTSSKESYESEISREETGYQYIVEKSASIDRDKGQISYRIAVMDKFNEAQDPSVDQEFLTTVFAVNANSDQRDIIIDDVMQIDADGNEFRSPRKIARPNVIENTKHIQTAGIKTVKPQYGVVYYLSSRLDLEAKKNLDAREYKFGLDMVINDNNGQPIYEDRYALGLDTKKNADGMTVDANGNISNSHDLVELKGKDKKFMTNGLYIEEINALINYVPATIKWSDYIFPEGKNQKFTYYFNLDENQDTSNTQIRIEFYEANDNGFIINNRNTQYLPYSNYLDLMIPEGQFARVVFTTTVKKDKTVPFYTFNGKKIDNLAYDLDGVGQAESEEGLVEDPQPEIKEDDKKTGIDLNSYGLIEKLKNEDKYYKNTSYFVKNTVESLDNYNSELINYDQLVNHMSTSAGIYKINQDLIQEIVVELSSGLSEDKYEKVLEIDAEKLAKEVAESAATPSSAKKEEAAEDNTKKEKLEKSETLSKEAKTTSGIELNKDALVQKLKREDKLDINTEYFIRAAIETLDNYNEEVIDQDQLLNTLAINAGQYFIEEETIATVLHGLTDGLSSDKYEKLVNINSEDLAKLVYEKSTIPSETIQTQTLEGAHDLETDEVSDPGEEQEETDDKTEENSEEELVEVEEGAEVLSEADLVEVEGGPELSPVEEFESALNQFDRDNLDTKINDKSALKRVADGLKQNSDQTNLQKANNEFKLALENEQVSLEDIQNLLLDLGERYSLTRYEEASLMLENEEAIKRLIKKTANQNFSPSLLYNMNALSLGELQNKKFNVRTRFDTSTIGGPIKRGQYFRIHLDDKLTVKDPSTLDNIIYNGQVIAKPTYDSGNNTITYSIEKDISENIQVPLNIPVDFNLNNLGSNEKTYTITNRVSGLGVTNPKDLLPVVVDDKGDIVTTIIEPNRTDVIQVVEYGDIYRIDIDSQGSPVVKDKELQGINWTLKVTSDTDLKSLGFVTNITSVEGSGLGEFENIKLNGEPINLSNNEIKGQLGIVDSKNHVVNQSTNELIYTFYTPVVNKQTSYMLDFSTYVKKKNKTGATRLLFDQGYPEEKVARETPNRVGMNNRTTILGEFTSPNTAKWVVTDAVATNDANQALPLETRTLQGAQTFASGQTAVYGLNSDGKMVVKKPATNINSIPEKDSNPSEAQPYGTIAVYQYNTNLTDTNNPGSDKVYDLSGVRISPNRDIKVNQGWNIPSGIGMPSQKLVVKDPAGNNLGQVEVGEGVNGKTERTIIIPNVKYFDIGPSGESTKIKHKIDQILPGEKTINGRTYTYSENVNYFNETENDYYIHNAALEKTQKIPATFTVTKIDSKDSNKKLAGASFELLGANISATTDSKGRAKFANIPPGSYKLIESKAPLGYKLDQSVKTVNISDDGNVSVSGNNVIFERGANSTEYSQHSGYPDFMNASYYGKMNSDGKIDFYIYLKSKSNTNGSTNKPTRLNINIDNGSISNVTVYDVNPNDRMAVNEAMNNQTVANKLSSLGSNILNDEAANEITGRTDVTDSYTNKNGYQVKIPAERFTNDWGFLVKVTGSSNDKTLATLSYDWLTDNANVAKEAKLQQRYTIDRSATASSTEANLTISNDEFNKKPVEVTKVDQNHDPLANATFELRDSEGNLISNVVTGEDGKANFGKISPGNYTVEEIIAPKGYTGSPVIFDVKVDPAGQVTYEARFKNGIGKPRNGVDYWIESEEVSQEEGSAKVRHVDQYMEIGEDESSIGLKRNVWEATMLESLNYHAKIIVDNASPGSSFVIQFDPNLDFTQYVNEMPKIKNANGVDIADPYFDYNNNHLTYVFNKNSTGGTTEAKIKIVGIIPTKYFAKFSGKYTVTNRVSPGSSGISGNPVDDYTFYAYYDSYDTQGVPARGQYFRDVYMGSDGNEYVDVLTYYNALGESSGSKELKYNWISTNFQKDKRIVDWKANGTPPAFALDDIQIYKVNPSIKIIQTGISNQGIATGRADEIDQRVNERMPLSFGVRPEQDSTNYTNVFNLKVNPNQSINHSNNSITVEYDPSQIQSTGNLSDNSPLTIKMPDISKDKEGYVIVQRFKVTNKENWMNSWRTFYLTGAGQTTAFTNKPNANTASADQIGQEVPKFYSESVKVPNKKYIPGKFTIRKVNEADRTKPLKGAAFALIGSEGTINRLTDDNGIITFTDLAPGQYNLIETRPPEGYNKSNKNWIVNVSDKGVVSITELGQDTNGNALEGIDLTLEVTNKPVGKDFVVYKKDDKNKPLAGATFTMTNVKTNESQTATSNDKGLVKFKSKLSEGDYILEETNAPDGYDKLDKKWVVTVDKDNNIQVYNYKENGASNKPTFNSILDKEGTNWVEVDKRPTTRFIRNDNRLTGYANNSYNPNGLGTRIIAINKNEKYVIQRFILNPEANYVSHTSITIHREKPSYTNMDWYNGSAEYEVYMLDKAITDRVEDTSLLDFNVEDITKQIPNSRVRAYGEPDRLKLALPETNKPIVIDIKIPYYSESAGVGLGADYNGNKYWKSDYYEKVSDIVIGNPIASTSKEEEYIGSYVSSDCLDVINESKKFGFNIKKIDEVTKLPIEGASFSLIGPKPEMNEVEMTSNKDGVIEFDKLEAGIYRLVETEPAYGYLESKIDWTITITRDGDVYTKENPTTQADAVPAMYDVEGIEVDGGAPILLDDIGAFNDNSSFGGLEMSDDIISNRVSASGWETVDPSKSDAPENKNSNDVKTKIIEIDKVNKRFKQRFLVNPNSEPLAKKAEFDIHRQPLTSSISPNQIYSYKIQAVGAGSTIDNIKGTPVDIKIANNKFKQTSQGNFKRSRAVIDNKSYSQPILIEIETDYQANKPLGLGMDFYPEGDSSVYPKKVWGAENYSSDAVINYKNNNTPPVDPPVIKDPKWEAVDVQKSTNRSNPGDINEYGQANVKTNITEIDKENKRFKQVFVYDQNPNGSRNRYMEIHSQPEEFNVNTTNTKVKVYQVGAGQNGNASYNDITSRVKIDSGNVNNYDRLKINVPSDISGQVLVEVETSYNTNSGIGLGTDYYSDYDNDKDAKSWLAMSYPTEGDIRTKSIPVTTYEIKETRTVLPIPEQPIRKANPDMLIGTEKEVFPGEKGYRIDVYEYTYEDGVVTGNPKHLGIKELVEAKPREIEYGTKNPEPEQRTDDYKQLIEPIPFETTIIEDETIPRGEVLVDQEGRNGEAIYEYSITYEQAPGDDAIPDADWPANGPKPNKKSGERVLSYNKKLISQTNPTNRIERRGIGEIIKPDGNLLEDKTVVITNTPFKTEIEFKKVVQKADPNSIDEPKPLKGAEFTLYKKDSNRGYKSTGKTETSGEDGKFRFTDLAIGDYKIEETTVPNGFVETETPVVEFRVTSDGIEINTGVVFTKWEKADDTNTLIENQRYGKIRIEKYEMDLTTPLPGAKFKIEGNGISEILEDDGNGVFTKDKLKPGNYTLQETQPPAQRYAPDKLIWKVEVKADGTTIISKQNDDYADSYEIPKDQQDLIKVKNGKAQFPSTGGNGVTIAFALIGTAIMLAGIAYYGIYINDKNRRRSNRFNG